MSLKAWYKFDNNGNDSIGNNNLNITATGSFTAGKIGNSFLGNGVSGAITMIPSASNINFNSNVWSITIWVKANLTLWLNNSDRYSIFDIGSYYVPNETDIFLSQHAAGASRTIHLSAYTNQQYGGGISQTFTDSELGEWIFFAINCDGNKLNMSSYCCQSTTWRVDSFNIAWDSRTYPIRDNLYLGGYGWATNNWRGNIDDVKIYDHSLSTKEIKEIAKAKILHYTFNDFQEPTTNYLYHQEPRIDELYTPVDLSGYGGSMVANHPNIIQVYSKNSGSNLGSVYYNGGVGNPTNSQHAYWVYDGDLKKPVVQMIDKNGSWQAKSYDCGMNAWSTYGFGVGTKYTISWMQWVSNISKAANVGMYTSNGTTTNFFDGLSSFTSTSLNTRPFLWERVYCTFTVSSNWNQTIGYNNIYMYGMDGGYHTIRIADVQLEIKDHPTPFTFNMRTGVIKDTSGYGNNAILTETTTPKWTTGRLGTGCYEFNKVNSMINVNQETNPTDRLSLCAWVKLRSYGSDHSTILQKTANYYLAVNSSGNLRSYWYGTSSEGYHTDNRIIPLNTWTHIASIWTGTQVKLYVNGIVGVIANTNTPGNSSNDIINIGIENGGRKHDGWVDDVRIYATALSDVDVLELYQTRAALDNKGNLFLNEITTNGFKPTLLDYSKWLINTSGSQIGGTNGSNFYGNGLGNENTIIIKENPEGNKDIVWATLTNDSSSNDDGGWNTDTIPINNTKQYRLSVWIKRSNIGNGNTYFGCQGNTVYDLQTTNINNNPYGIVWGSGTWLPYADQWLLWVFNIHPTSYGGGTISSTGVYTTKGIKIGGGTDYKWSNTATVGGHRTYLYYSTITDEKQFWYRPRFELIDGNEPSIVELLSCSEHRPLINDTGDNVWNLKNIGENGQGNFGDVSEVGVTEGLVGWWKLNGDARDYSGNNNHGNIIEAYISSGFKNQAYYFDGINDRIMITPTTPIVTKEITTSAWVYPIEAAGSRTRGGAISGNGNMYLGLVDSGTTWNLHWALETTSARLGSWSGTIPINQWTHILGTYDGSFMRAYINGVEVWNTPLTGDIRYHGDYVIGSYIGALTDGNHNIKGKITDARIYNRALSIDEVNILYKQGLSTTGMQLASDGTLYLNNEIKEGF